MGEIGKFTARGKVTSKGQTTIPKKIREALGLKAGTSLEWTADKGSVTLRPRNVRLKDLYGMLHRPGMKAMTVEEMDDAIAEAVRERYERSRDRS